MRKSLRHIAALCVVAIGLLVLASTSASAAYQAYIGVKGQKQGKYKGDGEKAKSSVKPITPSAPSNGKLGITPGWGTCTDSACASPVARPGLLGGGAGFVGTGAGTAKHPAKIK